METKDLTFGVFSPKSGLRRKLVIVKHAENNFSTFLVEDVKKPAIPGFPACCLTYYHSKEEALKDIEETYQRVGYKPKFPETGFWSN